MKKNLLLLAILMLGVSVAAQPINGTFKNGTDSLVFNGDKVAFSVSGFAGLSTTQVGTGTYEEVENFLLIHTGNYPGEKSRYEKLDASKTDTCVIRVLGSNGFALPGILVEPNTSSRRNPTGQVTGSDGRVYLTDTDKVETIRVSGMGFHDVIIDFEPNSEYRVILVNNEVIEDRTVVFQCEKLDDDTLSLLLLTDDFNDSKRRDSDLKKLEKRARRSNRIDKRFKKEYEPYIQRTQLAP